MEIDRFDLDDLRGLEDLKDLGGFTIRLFVLFRPFRGLQVYTSRMFQYPLDLENMGLYSPSLFFLRSCGVEKE